MSTSDDDRDPATPSSDNQLLAEVISLDSARGRRGAEETAAQTQQEQQAATSADEAPRPPRTLLGALMRQVADRLAAEVQSPEPSAVIQLLDHDAEQPAPEGQEEAEGAEPPVDLTMERLRRKGPTPSAVDLAAAAREVFDRFLDEHQTIAASAQPGEGEGTESAASRQVTIDGEFVRKHGATVVPALLNGLAETLAANLAGLATAPSALKPQKSEAEPAPSGAKPDLHAIDPADAPPPPRTEIKFDLLGVLAALIQPPPAAQADAPKPPPRDPDET